MEGQKRFVVESAGRFWRRRGNQHQKPCWTRDLSRATHYRTAGDAVNAARHIEKAPGPDLGVMELGLVVLGEHRRLPV